MVLLDSFESSVLHHLTLAVLSATSFDSRVLIATSSDSLSPQATSIYPSSLMELLDVGYRVLFLMESMNVGLIALLVPDALRG